MMNNIKINNYSKTTLSKFDIIGSYFVGVYYNELYKKAENLFLEEKYSTLTESYKSILYNYIKFTKTQQFFTKTIIGIHKYFIESTRFSQMTYKECIDFITSEFIPNDLFKNVKEHKKYNILYTVLLNCLEVFTEEILLNHIIKIIDNHSEENNCLLLQNIFLKIILLEKDKRYAKFINPEQKNHTIPIELFNNIQKKLIKSSQINKQLLHENNELNKTIENNILTQDKYVKEISKLKNNIKYLFSSYKQLENKVNYISPIISPLNQLSIQTQIQPPVQTSIQTQIQLPDQTPTQPPIQPPTQTPIQPPDQTPTQTPTQPPIQSPTQTPTQTLIQPPVQTLIQPSVQTLIQPPTQPIYMQEIESDTDSIQTQIVESKKHNQNSELPSQQTIISKIQQTYNNDKQRQVTSLFSDINNENDDDDDDMCAYLNSSTEYKGWNS